MNKLLCAWFFAHASVSAELSQQIDDVAYRKAVSLIQKYHDKRAGISEFTRAPSGLFRLEVAVEGESEKRVYFMLPDYEHLIQGYLISPYLPMDGVISKKHTAMIAQAKEIRQQISNFSERGQDESPVSIGARTAIPTPAAVPSQETAVMPISDSVVNISPAPSRHNMNTPSTDEEKEELWSLLETAPVIKIGDGDIKVYEFFDLGCPACVRTHESVVKEALKEHSNVQLNLVVVGVIQKALSMKLAVLAYLYPEQFITSGSINVFKNDLIAQSRDSFDNNEPGVAKAWGKARDNTRLFWLLDNPMTPTFIFRRDGEIVIKATANEQQIAALMAAAQGEVAPVKVQDAR